MSCFWTDFVNTFEDCSSDCPLFAAVLPTYETLITSGFGNVVGFADAHVDFGGGTFYIEFPSDSGITSCVITAGLAKMPNNGGDCDAGCCTQCLEAAPCQAFTSLSSPSIDYFFDTDGGGTATLVELPETVLVQDEVVPTRFSGPIEAIAPGVFDLVGSWVTAFHVSTNLGQLCDLRFSHHSCF